MPSPYAHMIAGSLLAAAPTRGTPLPRQQREDIATVLFFSLVPDLDAVPGLLAGNLSGYHNQISHSIAFGLMACLGFSVVRRILPAAPALRHTLGLTTLAYGLHLLMDSLTHGRGLMLAWPFSEVRLAAPGPIFYGLRYSEGLLAYQHLITLATETLLLLPLAWFFVRMSGRYGRSNATSDDRPLPGSKPPGA